MKKNILIIGGDSFIATNFINSLKDSYNIKVVSRKKTSFSNEFIIHDLFEIPNKLFIEIDVIINFCAIVHRKYVSNEVYKKINYELPIFLYEKSIKYNVKHFIQMSTISVYERNDIININSNEKPSNSYGLYKLKTDNYILNSKKIKISCIRSPMVYGANAPGNIKKIIYLAKLKIPLPFKNIDNKLSFINIKNLIHFLNVVIDKELLGVLIPTDKKVTSTDEIIKIVRNILHRNEGLFLMPYFFKNIFKILFPEIFKKVFESLVVECNVDNNFYSPNHTLSQGLEDYLKN